MSYRYFQTATYYYTKLYRTTAVAVHHIVMQVDIEQLALDFVQDTTHNIAALQVANNIFAFVLKSGKLFVIDLELPAKIHKCQIPLLFNGPTEAHNEKILNMWANPEGTHFLVMTNFTKYYMVQFGDNTLSFTNIKHRFKTLQINSVNWFNDNSLLIGTHSGDLISLQFVTNTKSIDQIKLSVVAKFDAPIEGILFKPDLHKLIIVIRDKFLYWYLPSTELIEIWNFIKKNTNNPTQMEQFDHVRKHDLRRKFITNNNQFAWITNLGIVYGNLDTDPSNNNNNNLTVKLLLNIELPESNETIRDITLSPFHLILLRGNNIIIVNQLSNKIIFNEKISTTGHKLIGLVNDFKLSTFWCFASDKIFEIILKDESKSVWKLLCEQHEFDMALHLDNLDNWEISLINYEKSLYLLDKGQIIEAATHMGKTDTKNIGSMITTLINSKSDSKLEKIQAIGVLLTKKLEILFNSKNHSSYRVQFCLLSNWIIWNFMEQLNFIENKIVTITTTDSTNLLQYDKLHNDIDQNLKSFINKYLSILDKKTIYQILNTQNRKNYLLYLATLLNDFDYILQYWISQNNWYESLKILDKINDVNIIYKYSNILLINETDLTITTWMKCKDINPVELIPAILNFFSKYLNETEKPANIALNYLQWCIDSLQIDEPIIFNTILYMMVADPNIKIDDIISCLENFDNKYDIDFVLRLSLKYNKIKISIYLYKKLHLLEDAINLSLENQMFDTAKQILNDDDLSNDPLLKKKLWLKTSKKLILKDLANFNSGNADDSNDIKKIISTIIADSKGTIEIKDLLPIFNEYVTIANVKDELLKSLQNHSDSMLQLSNDIKRSLQIKNDIRKDIELFKERYQILEPGTSCNYCHKLLQSRKFLVFPCSHSFHIDCMIKMIKNSNDFILKNKIDTLQRKLNKDKTLLKSNELEDLITAKCSLCSDININSIDELPTIQQTEIDKWNT